MNNPKMFDAANGEFQLPEAIIQRIQSFLSGKQAAPTSILSKSWHSAWLTRPNLDFNQRDFGCYYGSYGDIKGFLESAKKTMQRYEESNLNIESFKLCMDRMHNDSCVLGDELIAKALKLGATELFLSVCIYLCCSKFPTILWLERFNIDPVFSYDSSSEFPCLKVLTLRRCNSQKGIRISSPSLERISFARNSILRATFDVPNIRKFTFSGYNTLPSLAFERASRDWVSDLSIECGGIFFKPSWFLELEKFMEELCQSKVSLSLEIGYPCGFMSCHAQCLPKPVVENLTVKLHPKYITRDSTILECLFGSCEPKFITQYWEDFQCRGWSWRIEDNLLNLLCMTLMQDVSENCCVPNRNTSRLPGLEEVNVECFEKTLEKWRPLSLKALLDASTSLDDKQIIRFRLKWR